jgi:hypothetical protein
LGEGSAVGGKQETVIKELTGSKDWELFLFCYFGVTRDFAGFFLGMVAKVKFFFFSRIVFRRA